MKIILLTLIIFTASVLPAQTVSSFILTSKGITINSSGNIYEFNCIDENIIQVKYLPSGRVSEHTLVLDYDTNATVPFNFSNEESRFVISTNVMRAEISKNPIGFSISNANGTLISESILYESGMNCNLTGEKFYGVHSKYTAPISNSSGGDLYAGYQGEGGAPFLWTTSGFGLLFDADAGNISLSTGNLGFSKSYEKEDVNFYVISGTPAEIFKGMTLLSGKAPLFPKFSLGFINTEWGMDQDELLQDIKEYRKREIPIDAYVLDFDWMDWGSDNFGEFRWGSKFPGGPSGALKDSLEKYNFKLMGIRKPRVHVNTVQGQYCQNNQLYFDYTTDYWSGQEVMRIDFRKPEARQWYWNSFINNGTANSFNTGIQGYWNDEADEYGGNLMFMQMQRANYEGQRSFNNDRVWSINRNFYLGAQRYAYSHWTGDISSGFTSMQEQRIRMISSIALGSSWWSMDIGGFNGTPSYENYYRWIQFGAFVPVFRVHGTFNEEREPWNYGAQAEEIAKQAIIQRYKLMPYIYSMARENYEKGTPLVRPMFFEFPGDKSASEKYDEWMFGSSILVRPVVESGLKSAGVYFPEGTWIDYVTGKTYIGPKSVGVITYTDRIPMYVKGGSVIPEQPAGLFTDDPASSGILYVNSYSGGAGSIILYEDDGKSYDYESGIFRKTLIQNSNDAQKQSAEVIISAPEGNYEVQERDYIVKFNFEQAIPDSVKVNGELIAQTDEEELLNESITGWGYSSESGTCYVRFKDEAAEYAVQIFRSTTSVEYSEGTVSKFSLSQNYPNPFNPSTRISYSIPSGLGQVRVTLKVYNMLGQEVAVLVDRDLMPGNYNLSFDSAGNLASGIYLYRLQAGGLVETRKMTLIK